MHHQRTPTRRGDLQEIGGSRPDLAAERKTLDHARDHRDDRRSKTDRAIGRGQRDGQDRSPHQRKTQQHRRPPADTVGIDPEHEAADRAGDKPAPKVASDSIRLP